MKDSVMHTAVGAIMNRDDRPLKRRVSLQRYSLTDSKDGGLIHTSVSLTCRHEHLIYRFMGSTYCRNSDTLRLPLKQVLYSLGRPCAYRSEGFDRGSGIHSCRAIAKQFHRSAAREQTTKENPKEEHAQQIHDGCLPPKRNRGKIPRPVCRLLRTRDAHLPG
jgi:hypothetical protein